MTCGVFDHAWAKSFLDAITHLYRRVCLSVCPFIQLSVCPSVRSWVALKLKSWKIDFFHPVTIEQVMLHGSMTEVLSVTITVSSKSKGTITTTNTQRIRSDWRTLFILFLSALRLILAAWSNLLLAFWSRCGTVKRSRDCFDCSANFFEGQPCLFFFLAIAFLRRNPFMMIPNLSYNAYFFSNLVINLTASICNSRLEWAAWKIRLVWQLPRHR